MQTKLVEVTNGPRNWGKFLLGRFDTEWDYISKVDEGRPLLRAIGWRGQIHPLLILDLQTGEGALFSIFKTANAAADLQKHRIWVCPMFEPFLVWLYSQPDPWAIPDYVDLPDAEFQFQGYRRPGPPR